MRKYFAFLCFAVVIAALPTLTEIFRPSAAGTPLALNVKIAPELKVDGCVDEDRSSSLWPMPIIESHGIDTRHLVCQRSDFNGSFRLFRYTFDAQSGDFEAVSSVHQFVRREDRQRHGTTTKTFGGLSVNEQYMSKARSIIGLSWHWYQVGGQQLHDPKLVKLVEFARALIWQPVIPSVYVVQWFPKDRWSISIENNERHQLENIVLQFAQANE